MEWNQLHAFRVTAEKQNVSRAADELHVSQSSLSQTIRRLEENLGFPLFKREGKRIFLNASGRMLLETVKRMEEMMEDTLVRLEEENGRPHPEVKLHMGCASMLLPELLRYLRQQNPDIRFRISQWNASVREEGKILRILAAPLKQKDSIDTLLLEEPVLLALPEGHRLVHKCEICLDDLREENFISLSGSWELSRLIQQEMDKRGMPLNVTMRVDNPNLLRELLREGMGVAFVPAVTWRLLTAQGVTMRRVSDCAMGRSIYLNTPVGHFLTREERACISSIRKFFKQESVEWLQLFRVADDGEILY